MKRIMMMMALMLTIVASAKAITYSEARTEALFLTDKMAYELRLSPEQVEAVYEINLDYMLSVAVHDDLFGTAWARRNADLRYVLSMYQYEVYQDTNYFYRPLYWTRNRIEFRIYSMYTDRTRFYVSYRPSGYDTFRGGRNVGSVSYYAHRNYNQPVNIRPAMMGRPRSTWRDVPGNSRNDNMRTPPPPRPNNNGRSTTTRQTYNDNSLSRTRTVTTTRTTRTATAPSNNSSSHGTTTAPGQTQESKTKGTFGGKR